MKFTDQILFDLTDIDNETFKIQGPLDYEKDKKPLQHPRIKELQKQDNQIINIQNDIPLSKKQSRQEILTKWKEKRKKLIFKKKKVTCIKKSEYATGFKKRGPNGRFISK